MDLKDYEGVEKFKYIVPSIFILNWILMIIGPVYFPVNYQYYCAIGWIAIIVKMAYLNYNMIVILKRTFQTFKRENKNDLNDQILQKVQNIVHCFIIPSYNQDPQLIGQTLSWIAKHSKAKTNYMIMLAMEQHEEKSDLKAEKLKQQYSHYFKIMDYTVHQIKSYQQKGKASNVSWCAERLEEFFSKYSVDMQNVLLTVIDADSWVPPLYCTKVEQYLQRNYGHFNFAIFVPPQIFTRNYLDVPMITRIFDHTHSLAQLSNMRSNQNLIFPISNYSISYILIKRIGFWDTCADAIGQDFHMTQKAFWKTDGQAFNVPIYVPFNQVNVQTGNGYFQDIKARFWQAQRHAQGCADVAYNINMILKTQLFTAKSILMVYYIAECFILPAIMPWIAFSTLLQNNIYFYIWPKPQNIISLQTIKILTNLTTFLSITFYSTFQIFKRYTNKKVYNKQNQSLWRLLQYPINLTLGLIFIAVPTFIIAAFRVLQKNREYRVAQKKIII